MQASLKVATTGAAGRSPRPRHALSRQEPGAAHRLATARLTIACLIPGTVSDP